MPTLAELQLGPSRLRTLKFLHAKQDGTSTEIHVEIRALTKREMDLARVNARRTVERLDSTMREGPAFDELLEDARIVEILAIACRKPEDPTIPWSSPLEIEAMLSTAEITALWMAYVEHQADASPIIRDLTPENFETLVQLIAKEGSADPLLLFASPLRNAFTITLVRELVTLRMSSSSSSSASSEPSGERKSSGSESENTESSIDAALDRLADNAADLAVLRDQVASLTVRVATLEGAPGTSAINTDDEA